MPSDLVCDKLDQFVSESDRLGGPACEAYWKTLKYIPTIQIDQGLDPYGAEYTEGMLRLYQEISGRPLNQSQNEDTHFDLPSHSVSANPYAHQSPQAIAKQVMTLVQAIAAIDKSTNAQLLDMGAGWGLSSEVFEYLGYRVTAVDINPQFVELVASRARRRGLQIEVVQSSFDDFKPAHRFDVVVFFESLHHSVEPWGLLARIYECLEPDGVLLLLAEPVQDIWWRYWGLRLDPLSLYCIRKYGWFESGWSAGFLFDMLSRAGFSTLRLRNTANSAQSIFLCSKATTFTKADLEKGIEPSEFWVDPAYVVSKGDITLEFSLPRTVTSVEVEMWNFRPWSVGMTFRINAADSVEYHLSPGRNLVCVPYGGGLFNLRIVSECWSPNVEIGKGDTRERCRFT